MQKGRIECVGVSFREEPPSDMRELRCEEKYCRLIGRARGEAPFYLIPESISCPLARFHLGIGSVDMGEMAGILVGWGDAADVPTGRAYLEGAPRLAGVAGGIAFFRPGRVRAV